MEVPWGHVSAVVEMWAASGEGTGRCCCAHPRLPSLCPVASCGWPMPSLRLFLGGGLQGGGDEVSALEERVTQMKRQGQPPGHDLSQARVPGHPVRCGHAERQVWRGQRTPESGSDVRVHIPRGPEPGGGDGEEDRVQGRCLCGNPAHDRAPGTSQRLLLLLLTRCRRSCPC